MGGLKKQITGNNDMKGKKNLGKEKWTSRIRQKKRKHKRKDQWVEYSEGESNQKQKRGNGKKKL